MTDTLNERNRRLRRKGFLRNRSKMLDDDGNLVANEQSKADGNIKGKKVQESRTLTELSKGTLKSYIIKALDSKDAEYHASDDAFNRSQQKSNNKEYRSKQLALSKFHARKYDRRNKGINRATDKFLSKEDVEYAVSQLTEEQTYDLFLDIIYEHSVEDAEKFLTELSKKTLASYLNKSKADFSNLVKADNKALTRRMRINPNKPGAAEKTAKETKIKNDLRRKMGNRATYVVKASKKLRAESVEPLTELSRKTLDSYLGKTVKYDGGVYDRDVDLKVAKKREAGRVKARNRKNGVMNDNTKPRYHNGFSRLKKYRAD